MGKPAVFSGEDMLDIRAAMHVFLDSEAWRRFGFFNWMQDYTVVHYALDDDQMEGEPIAFEVLVRQNDDEEKGPDSYSTDGACATALANAGLHALEKTCREAQDLV